MANIQTNSSKKLTARLAIIWLKIANLCATYAKNGIDVFFYESKRIHAMHKYNNILLDRQNSLI